MWGLKGKDVTDLDPVVKILLGSCAKEIEKLGNELLDAEQRVIRRLTEYILPDVYTGVRPAHAILQSIPVDDGTWVNSFNRWKYEYGYRIRPESPEEERVKVVFSPARQHRLTTTQIVMVADYQGLHVHPVLYGTGKTLITNEFRSRTNEVWIALKDLPDDLEELEVYFDWTVRAEQDELYRLLEFVYCQDMNGNQIPHRVGYASESEGKKNFGKLLSSVEKIEEEVSEFYRRRFLTLSAKHIERKHVELPEHVTQFNSEGLTWVKLIFPSQISDVQISDLVVYLNCMAVINRDLEQQVFRLSGESNIRSLNTKGYYLEVQSLLSHNGFEYQPNPSIGGGNQLKGTYMVRGMEIGRFDARQALELIDHTLNQVKDEQVAFSSMNVDAITGELRTLRTALQRIYSMQPKDQPRIKNPFIVVYQNERSDTVHLSYWTMSGIDPAYVRKSLYFNAVDSSLFEGNIGVLASNPVGENLDVSPKRRLDQMRSAVLSRGRLVTAKDLEQRCKYLFGETIKHIRITKGVMVSERPGQGLMRCIYVDVQRADDSIDQYAWDALCAQVNYDIKNEAEFIYPVRIRVSTK
jgi:hypothetical protein